MEFSASPTQRRTGIFFECHLQFYFAGTILVIIEHILYNLEWMQTVSLKEWFCETLNNRYVTCHKSGDLELQLSGMRTGSVSRRSIQQYEKPTVELFITANCSIITSHTYLVYFWIYNFSQFYTRLPQCQAYTFLPVDHFHNFPVSPKC